jgi:hypothetical protein
MVHRWYFVSSQTIKVYAVKPSADSSPCMYEIFFVNKDSVNALSLLQPLLSFTNRMECNLWPYSDKLTTRYPFSFTCSIHIGNASPTIRFNCSFHWHVQQERRFIHAPHATNPVWESYLFHICIERSPLLSTAILYARVDFTGFRSTHSVWKILSTQYPYNQPVDGRKCCWLRSLRILTLNLTAVDRMSMRSFLANFVK